MAKKSSSLGDLFATLKSYINQLADGERTPAEVGTALNDWARDSADSVKAKIQEEVEAAVLKMGFVKREEFNLLNERLLTLEKSIVPEKKTPVRKKGSAVKATTSPRKSAGSVKK